METKERPTGSVFGAALLIAGCCIGAAMLGLPVLTSSAGFLPTSLFFFLVWLYMATTGLLLLEVNVRFHEETNLVSMAKHTLGNTGKIATWILFLYLFYSLMVAYVQGAGLLFADFFSNTANLPLPPWIGSLLITVLFGSLIYLGTGTVDLFNRLLMVGLLLTYALLLAIGLPHIEVDLLLQSHWKVGPLLIPAMVVSFGYHNLVPSLSTYLKHDIPRARNAILIGSAIPLVVYLLWEAVILGICRECAGFQEALDSGEMASQLLRRTVGSSWILTVTQYFSYFAIITSFLAVALSFVDFLSDGLHVEKTGRGKITLCLLTLFPPFLFALLYPNGFLIALQYAGGLGAVTLFGILPALMVWQGRYREHHNEQIVVPGGKIVLLLVLLFSLGTIALQFFKD